MYSGGPKPSRFASQQDFETAADSWWISKRQQIADKLDLLVGIPDTDISELTAAQWLQRRELLLDLRERCLAHGFLVEINEVFLDPDLAPSQLQSVICEALGWEHVHFTGREGGITYILLPPSGVPREQAIFARLGNWATQSSPEIPSSARVASAPALHASRVDVCILDQNGIHKTVWTIGEEVPAHIFEKAYDAKAECLYAITTYDAGRPRTFVTTRERWLQARAAFGRIDPSAT
jgi:hypothetical protein